jgi:hypothetical protein
MNEQLPLAEIPVGFFEYRTNFKEPIFSTWYEGRHSVVREMYKVLLPWGMDLEKISWNATPKNAKEVQVTFAVPTLSVLISVGIGGVTLIANNANWSQASTLSALLQAVVDGVKNIGSTELDSHQTVLGFHLKPGAKSFRDVLHQFVDAKALGQTDAAMLGVGFYGADHSLIIDNSAVIQGGVFVKITRTFQPATRFEEMASILWKEEEGLLHRLGFRTQQ